MVIVAARPAIGKALALDTWLPTPTGWTTMGDVGVGDELIGADGRPTRVLGATEVLTGRPCYRVEFSDGTAVVADALHEWLTECEFEAEIRTTEALAAELGHGKVHVVRTPAPLCGQAALTHWTSPRLECGVDAGWKVVAVEPVATVPVRCVEVDAADHLYLAGRSMIPTHNSALGLDIARSASIRNGLPSVIFSLEMSRTEITMRLLSAEARIPMQHMRNGSMSDDDWGRLVRKMSEVSAAPLFIDDSPNLTMMEIRAKARRLKQRHDLRLIVIDYLQLMTSGKKVESRQLEVSEFSRQIKLLAKELDIPVIAISQLNRGSEQRTSKRPLLSDLRESGSLEQDADVVILLHREDAYERESTRPGEADLIIAKHRNGPTRDIVLAFQGHYSRFVDMAQD
jgi:replicative DNA helicase